MTLTRATLCLSLLFLSPLVARADSWLPPSPKIFANEDGDKTLKIVPGQGSKAGATWVRLNADGSELPARSFPLVNMPLRVLVPNSQFDCFVTLDTYARIGYEHAVVVYRTDGTVVRDLKLEDLLTPAEIKEHVRETAGSRWWRNGASFNFVVPTVPMTEGTGDKKRTYEQQDPENIALRIHFTWNKQVDVRLKDGKVTAIPALNLTFR
jgi:hypothetical protein